MYPGLNFFGLGFFIFSPSEKPRGREPQASEPFGSGHPHNCFPLVCWLRGRELNPRFSEYESDDPPLVHLASILLPEKLSFQPKTVPNVFR